MNKKITFFTKNPKNGIYYLSLKSLETGGIAPDTYIITSKEIKKLLQEHKQLMCDGCDEKSELMEYVRQLEELVVADLKPVRAIHDQLYGYLQSLVTSHQPRILKLFSEEKLKKIASSDDIKDYISDRIEAWTKISDRHSLWSTIAYDLDHMPRDGSSGSVGDDTPLKKIKKDDPII